MKVSIIGAGHFGYALSIILPHETWLYDADDELMYFISKNGRHPSFRQKNRSKLGVCPNADAVILAVPAQSMRRCVRKMDFGNALIIHVSKGLEHKTNKRMSEVISEYHDNNIAVLSGGMLAQDIIKKMNAGACAAGDRNVIKVFEGTNIHIEYLYDMRGVELAGAFKNVAAITAGFMEKHGESTKAYCINKVMNELVKIAVHMGAKPSTFRTYAWIGDLLTTCYGDSRDRQFGKMLSRGISCRKAKERLGLVEGVETFKFVSRHSDYLMEIYKRIFNP